MVMFPEYKAQRMAELYAEQWGAARIPDLLEVIAVAKPRTVLEIGCYRGVSTEVWLLHCAAVVAVDPWPDVAVRRDFLARCSHYPNLEMIEGFSPAQLERVRERSARGDYRTEMFDLCYIDGDHSYEAVVKDMIGCRDLIAPGGFIGGHDYGGDCPGVEKAVDEMLGHKPDWRFSDGSWLHRW
jgi:predicted O-methyltransferase YrrM